MINKRKDIYKRIINVKLEKGHYAKEDEETIIEAAKDFMELAGLDREERITRMNEEIRPKYKETRDKSLLAVYEALYCIEEPEKAFSVPSDWELTEVKKDYLSDSIEEEEVIEVSKSDKTKGTVELVEEVNYISLVYKYDKHFINVVKKLGCQWDGDSWKTVRISNLETAYIVNELVKAGFRVQTDNKDILKLIEDGTVAKANGRYIIIDKDGINIFWRGYDADIYNEARKINSSKWSGEHVIIDKKFINDVIEFSRINDFIFLNSKDELEDMANKQIIIDPVTKNSITKEETFEILPDLLEEV